MERLNAFSIKTDSYQGPLDLVLDLIERRKLLVNDLALANITEDFIQHVRAQKTFPVEETANFIHLAATLLLIKSKSLIPDLILTEEESEDVDDLKKRLAAYERVREASRELAQIYGRSVMVSAGEKAPEVTFAPARDLTKTALAEALARVLAAREEVEALPEARVKSLITIEEMMDRLAKRVQSAMNLTFKDFAPLDSAQGKRPEEVKIEIIVSFLALLELMKQGSVAAEQHSQHGDIHMTHTETSSIPRYG